MSRTIKERFTITSEPQGKLTLAGGHKVRLWSNAEVIGESMILQLQLQDDNGDFMFPVGINIYNSDTKLKKLRSDLFNYSLAEEQDLLLSLTIVGFVDASRIDLWSSLYRLVESVLALRPYATIGDLCKVTRALIYGEEVSL